MKSRIHRLNLLAIAFVTWYTVAVVQFFSTRTIVSPVVDAIVIFLTSMELYHILTGVLYRIVSHNKTALKLYWGREFLDGLWYYTYFREGEKADPNKLCFGVWRFEQDLFQTRVSGLGLTDKFLVRSRVRSITDLVEVTGAYEIFNVRTDNAAPDRDFYSRSSMQFDANRASWLNHPVKIRGKTIIYGGVLTGDVHVDVYVKCESAKNEDEAIEMLKKYLESLKANANT